jgi:hypothetical protein
LLRAPTNLLAASRTKTTKKLGYCKTPTPGQRAPRVPNLGGAIAVQDRQEAAVRHHAAPRRPRRQLQEHPGHHSARSVCRI